MNDPNTAWEKAATYEAIAEGVACGFYTADVAIVNPYVLVYTDDVVPVADIEPSDIDICLFPTEAHIRRVNYDNARPDRDAADPNASSTGGGGGKGRSQSR